MYLSGPDGAGYAAGYDNAALRLLQTEHDAVNPYVLFQGLHALFLGWLEERPPRFVFINHQKMLTPFLTMVQSKMYLFQ
jgi:hypothetical protein